MNIEEQEIWQQMSEEQQNLVLSAMEETIDVTAQLMKIQSEYLSLLQIVNNFLFEIELEATAEKVNQFRQDVFNWHATINNKLHD